MSPSLSLSLSHLREESLLQSLLQQLFFIFFILTPLISRESSLFFCRFLSLYLNLRFFVLHSIAFSRLVFLLFSSRFLVKHNLILNLCSMFIQVKVLTLFLLHLYWMDSITLHGVLP